MLTSLPQAVTSGFAGGRLETTDDLGVTYCLTNVFGSEGGWGGLPCSASSSQFEVFGPGTPGPVNVTLIGMHGCVCVFVRDPLPPLSFVP